MHGDCHLMAAKMISRERRGVRSGRRFAVTVHVGARCYTHEVCLRLKVASIIVNLRTLMSCNQRTRSTT